MPLGLLQLAAAVRARRPQLEIRIVDQSIAGLSDEALARLAVDGNFELVGLSVFSHSADRGDGIAKLIKKAAPSTVVVTGGPHPSAQPHDALRASAVDYAVCDEGEQAFTSLLSLLEDGGSPNAVAGLVWRDATRVVANPPELIADLDALPLPAWDLIDPRPYWRREGFGLNGVRPYFSLMTSRGCSHDCTFCHRIFGKQFRPHSPTRVLLEMEHLQRAFGVREFELIDDTFNLDLTRASEILRAVRQRLPGTRLLFPNGLHAARLSPSFVDELAAAGTTYVSFAPETASTRMQRLIHKGFDAEAMRAAMQRAVDRHLLANGFFMLGLPTETREEMLETIRFAVSSPLHTASFHRVVPFPGTAMFDALPAEQRTRLLALGRDSYTYDACAINVSAVPDDELRRLRQRAFVTFYSQPRRIARVLRDHPRRWHAVRSFTNLFAMKIMGARTHASARSPNGRDE